MVVCLVVVAGIRFGLIGQRLPTSEPQTAPEMDTDSAATSAAKSRFFTRSVPGRAPATAAATQSAGMAATPDPDFLPDWAERVDDVLRAELEPAEIGRQLLEMLPRLPAEGRRETLEHAANLLADEDYTMLATMLTDPATTEDELDVLMRDLLHRPNAIKLPALLTIARTAEHPQRVEAREILAVFVGDDYGDDWKQWEAMVAAWLKEETDSILTETLASDGQTVGTQR